MITTIQLSEFRGYTRELLFEFLSQAPTRFFDIVLPKTSHLKSMRAGAVMEDFLLALHLSQNLQRISYDIMCMMTDPGEPGKLSQLIITDRLEELAALLEPYVNGFDVYGRPNHELLAFAGNPYPAPGEAIACQWYHEVYKSLSGNERMPHKLPEL